ncbi:MAG: hypothetical protein A3J28_05860 [Acidobacteria bacterium RIFCSPLOWO2_12_FULL_60_22]|nr:MAG: hypothetical protein A3J28_05860 [Acidobacteria bacterium RIFCSPLOWO2_12_FULL_60_22]
MKYLLKTKDEIAASQRLTLRFRTMLGWAGTVLVGVSSLQAAMLQQSVSPASMPAARYREVLNRYCVTCHNEKLKTAGLLLDKVSVETVPAGAEVWEKVIEKLRGSAMPPPGLPRPDQTFYNDFPTYLETEIDRAAFAKLDPGRPTARRLNRAEYGNAIRDLLAVDVDAKPLLPTDDTGYGFDNIGDVLSVSPTLLERYLSAARMISRLAIGDPAMRAVPVTYQIPFNLKQDSRMSEDLPFGSRGGTVIRHHFPADGEYVVKIRLSRDQDAANGDGGTIRGVGLKRQMDIRLDGARIKLFEVGGQRLGRSTRAGAFGVGGGLFQGDPEQLEYEIHGADAGLEVRFPTKAGPHAVGVAFLVEDRSESEGINRGGSGRRGEPVPAVDSIMIRGPYDPKGLGDTPSRRKIFVCHPANSEEGSSPLRVASLQTGSEDEEICARKILSTLARRAYRRPVADEDIQPLLSIYKTGRSGGSFEEGIRMALQRILVGPEFLFRIEEDPPNTAPGTIYRIGDLELASRLSFFLWSTIPDDELLNLAELGKLKDPAVLDTQVRRMLRDPRSKALVSNFFGQWLQLRRVAELEPDLEEFPDFDENLRGAFLQETELFLESMVREDRPLLELLDANYTFVNERLAEHYGIPDVHGSSFRRVTLTDENRRGLLGQGSILSLTSYPVRTSVVLRGVWLLTNILATPPPDPPANVPALEASAQDGKIRSVRQAMEAHRANPVCASCHARMDPLGFALENFDAVGQWRTTEGEENTPIDSSGTLPDGTRIQGPTELRKILLGKADQFAMAVIERLLTYSVGRGAEYYDRPFVRKVRREAAPDFRWSSLISAIIKSEPFQMRRTLQP